MAVTILGSQREGLCTTAMHGYWQAVMTLFGQELLGSCGFSLIRPDGLHDVISAHPRLLLSTKSMVAYASVDTRFFTHDLIKEDGRNDHPCTPKIMIALHASICSYIICINSFIAYHKNDLKILMVCPVSKSDHRIERYRMIKFARSTCIVSR